MGNFQKYGSQNVGQDFILLDFFVGDILTHCKYTLDVFADSYMYSLSVVQRLFHSDWFRGTRHQLFSHAN
jgi:hypothetical protein